MVRQTWDYSFLYNGTHPATILFRFMHIVRESPSVRWRSLTFYVLSPRQDLGGLSSRIGTVWIRPEDRKYCNSIIYTQHGFRGSNTIKHCLRVLSFFDSILSQGPIDWGSGCITGNRPPEGIQDPLVTILTDPFRPFPLTHESPDVSLEFWGRVRTTRTSSAVSDAPCVFTRNLL